MVICSAFGCNSNSVKKVPGITFHRFPSKNSKMCDLWITNMHRDGWTPNKHCRVCSKHFEPHLFYRIGDRTCLVDEAVPTIFEELPKYLQSQAIDRLHPTNESTHDSDEEEATFEEEEYTHVEYLDAEYIDSEYTDIEYIDESIKGDEASTFVLERMPVDTPRIRQLEKKLFKEKAKNIEKTKKIKLLYQDVRRFKKRNEALKQIIKDLKSRERKSPLIYINQESSP